MDIYLAYMVVRWSSSGTKYDCITQVQPLDARTERGQARCHFASHYIVSAGKKGRCMEKIRAECDAQVSSSSPARASDRSTAERTNYDIEMLN